MRANCVALLVDAWYTILTQYQTEAPDIANSCIAVLGSYISWIDVNYVVNDRFIPLLFQFLEMSELRYAV